MVVFGKIVEPYGVQGWIRIHTFADDPLAWAKIPAWWLSFEGKEDWKQTEVKASRLHRGGLICQLEGVADRSAAEALKGMLVSAPREALPLTVENEYYWGDLIGLSVINTTEDTLGQVEDLIETGANDVLRVVSKDGTERLLPFVETVVLSVEKENGRIRVDWGTDW